jgi:hypothetical protein
LALANALEVNTSVTNIELRYNAIGAEGASVLINALKVNTSVTTIDLYDNKIDESKDKHLWKLIRRNIRLRRLFLFDARKMLLSVMCADWCGIVWPYLLDGADLDTMKVVPDNVETLRAEFAVVVEERRRRAAAAAVARSSC